MAFGSGNEGSGKFVHHVRREAGQLHALAVDGALKCGEGRRAHSGLVIGHNLFMNTTGFRDDGGGEKILAGRIVELRGEGTDVDQPDFVEWTTRT
jgi:hypothetical protein